MTLAQRFEAYAADFERTFVDDDWSRLEQYFTEDAVYSTPANALRVLGREKVLAVLRAAVSGFDGRCDSRVLVTTEGPDEVGSEVRRFTRPKLKTSSTHGTGCTLSAAIAAGLALGRPLERAVSDALDFVHRAIATAPGLGKGHGPLNHFAAAPGGS